jgi:hypothetical protein
MRARASGAYVRAKPKQLHRNHQLCAQLEALARARARDAGGDERKDGERRHATKQASVADDGPGRCALRRAGGSYQGHTPAERHQHRRADQQPIGRVGLCRVRGGRANCRRDCVGCVQLEREAERAARLRHERVVRVHALSELVVRAVRPRSARTGA